MKSDPINLCALESQELHALTMVVLRADKAALASKRRCLDMGLGIAEFFLLHMIGGKIIRQMENTRPSDERMRGILRYEQPLKAILNHWQGDIMNYEPSHLDDAIDRCIQGISQYDGEMAQDRCYEPEVTGSGIALS